MSLNTLVRVLCHYSSDFSLVSVLELQTPRCELQFFFNIANCSPQRPCRCPCLPPLSSYIYKPATRVVNPLISTSTSAHLSPAPLPIHSTQKMFFGHEQTAQMCARYVNNLFCRPNRQPLQPSNTSPSLTHSTGSIARRSCPR